MENSSLKKNPEKNASKEKHFLALLNVASEVEPVMETAAALAGLYKGKITAQNFVVVPPQTPLSVGIRYAEGPSKNLRIASQYFSQNLPAEFRLLLSHDRRLSILNTTHEKNIDYVILGFKGCIDIYKNLKKALSKIPTNVLILRSLPNKKICDCSRILVPLLKGLHTSLAVDIAGGLAEAFGKDLCVYHEFEPQISEEIKVQVLDKLDSRSGLKHLERITSGHNSIISSILKDVKEDNLLILPAYKPLLGSWFRLRRRGSPLLKDIIQESVGPVMIVKKHEPSTGFFQKILKRERN